MKTIKSIIALAFITFLCVNTTQSQQEFQERVLKISLQEASCNRGLVNALHQQVEQVALLSPDHPGMYIATIRCGRNYYMVHASYKEWMGFFKIVQVQTRNKTPYCI